MLILEIILSLYSTEIQEIKMLINVTVLLRYYSSQKVPAPKFTFEASIFDVEAQLEIPFVVNQC